MALPEACVEKLIPVYLSWVSDPLRVMVEAWAAYSPPQLLSALPQAGMEEPESDKQEGRRSCLLL